MNRAVALRILLFFILLFTATGSALTQDDTREFRTYTQDGMSRIAFTYSTQIAEDAGWDWAPADPTIETPTGPIPEYTRVTFQNYTAASGWVNTGHFIDFYPTMTFPDVPYPYAVELNHLREVLAARPTVPDDALPMLPIVTASQYFKAQVKYVDFAGGSGVRYITAAGLDVSPLSNEVLFYTFQGLTDDGAYYIAAQFPISAPTLPDVAEPMNTDEYNAFAANYDAYLADITAQLDALAPSDFSTDLTVYDALFVSLIFTPPAATFFTPDGAETGTAAYGPVSFSYDASLTSRVEIDLIESVTDPGGETMFGSQPGYTVFSLYGYPLERAVLRASVRVMPVAEFPGADTISDQLLAQLVDFLAERPALTANADADYETAIPVLPAINAAQVIVAQPQYVDFASGSGVRFVTWYSQGVNPITNDAIFYQFIGMTSDGRYVVAAQLPVNAPVLPEIDYTTLDYDAFAANYTTYLAETLAALDGLDAESYTPALGLLDSLIASITIAE